MSNSEQGIVVKNLNDLALVKLRPSQSCENCSAKIFCRPNKDGDHLAIAKNPLNAKPGQQVSIAEIGLTLLTLSILQYGLPLLGLLIGVFTVYLTNFNPLPIAFELTMSIGGAIGLTLGGVCGWGLIRMVASRLTSVFEIVSVDG